MKTTRLLCVAAGCVGDGTDPAQCNCASECVPKCNFGTRQKIYDFTH